MSDSQQTSASSSFPTTQWTQIISVIQKGDDAAAWQALSQFCERYRPAVHNFFRRRGCSPEEADDHTQEFFSTRIMADWEQRAGFLISADRKQTVRFRSF